MPNNLRTLIQTFTNRLSDIINAEAVAKVRSELFAKFGIAGLAPGQIRRRAGTRKATVTGRPRKKAPVQLCPVPGCKNPAAPIFGMVCATHKDLPKAKIKKYREARRAAKMAASGKAPARKKVRKSRVNKRRTVAQKPTPKKKIARRASPKKATPKKASAKRASPKKVSSSQKPEVKPTMTPAPAAETPPAA